MPPKPEGIQTPEQLAEALAAFFEEFPAAVVLDEGKVLFDLRFAKYTLSTEHGRCTLHLWSDDRNLVRTVLSATPRKQMLRLATSRFGQSRPQTLELAADRDRRTPSTREATRTRFVKVLERALERHFEGWRPDSFRTAMDLEKSFGPAYARGLLVQGQKAWAVIAVNEEETPQTIDGILTLGILWLDHCRMTSGGRRLVQGLRLIVPAGTAALTLSRIAWLHPDRAQWQLFEFHQREEVLAERDPADHGNLSTHLVHAPNFARASERFAASIERVMALVPAHEHPRVEQRLRSPTYLAFLLHGLEFARIKVEAAVDSFNRVEEISVGTGAQETILRTTNESPLRELIAALFVRRSATGSQRDPVFRAQPERWLESNLRQHLEAIEKDPARALDPAHVYTQVPAFAASDRGMLDLLSVAADGRLAVLELKAAEDMHLALQGLDYWIRVRWHHTQNAGAQQHGLDEFQRHGYFGGVRLSPEPPRLYLIAPALRVHPATESVLRYLSPRVDWTLVALDERWRQQIRVIWRKRPADL